MPENLRRHSVLMSDHDLAVLERAVRVYVEVIRIQVPIHQPQREANAGAHVAGVLQGHRNCQCPSPPEPIIEGAHL